MYDYYGDRISEDTYETVQMPPRPANLTETAYARLLFENECSVSVSVPLNRFAGASVKTRFASARHCDCRIAMARFTTQTMRSAKSSVRPARRTRKWIRLLPGSSVAYVYPYGSIVKKHVAVEALKAGKKKAVVEEIVFSLVTQPYNYRSDTYYVGL